MEVITIRRKTSDFSRYEKAIVLNMKLMKFFYIILVIANVAMPLGLEGESLRFGFSAFNLLVLGFQFYGLLSGLGYFSQQIPFLPVSLVRLAQGLYRFVMSPNQFNWIGFGILVVFDILFIAFLFMDRRDYSYVEEEETGEDF